MTRKKKLVLIAESTNPRGVVVPKHYFAYFLLIKWHPTRDGKLSNIDLIKTRLLKPVFTLCELVAQI